MANWLRLCSSRRRAPRTNALPTNPSRPDTSRQLARAAACCATLLAAACGQAQSPAGSAAPVDAAASAAPQAPPAPSITGVLCAPADAGYIRARLQGALDAEIDWSAPDVPQCLGGLRPGESGLRLVYKGSLDGAPLLIVVGVANLARGAASRNVPANVTLVREGTGAFWSTRGDDKCALDEVTQEPVAGRDGRYRLSARGYCTQPARALGNDDSGAVLVSRFDVAALVDYPKEGK